MKLLRVLWRLCRTMWHAAAGYVIIKMVFPRIAQAEREARVTRWSHRMLSLAGIELRVIGQPARSGPMLLVANHISWLDIVVMHAAGYCRFVSKSDVKAWPLVGSFADGAGTLYVERSSRRDAHRVVAQMAQRLLAGDVLAVFPEGTTGNGVDLLNFHANLIQSAIDAQVPIQPVALAFIDAVSGAASFAPSYTGDETLIGSMWRTLSAEGLCAVVAYGEPQSANGRSRRTWAEALRDDIGDLRRPRAKRNGD